MGPQMEGMETLMGQWGHTPYPIIPVYPSMYPYGGYQGPHIGCHPRPSGRAQNGAARLRGPGMDPSPDYFFIIFGIRRCSK